MVSVSAAAREAWQEWLDTAAAGASLPASCLGVVAADATLRVRQAGTVLLEQPVARLADCFETAIPRRMKQASPPPER